MEAFVHEFADLAMEFLQLSEENPTNPRGVARHGIDYKPHFSRFTRLPPFSKQLS